MLRSPFYPAEAVGPAFGPEGKIVAPWAARPEDGRNTDDGKVEPAQHKRLAGVAPLMHLLFVVVAVMVVEDDVPPKGNATGHAARIMKPDVPVTAAPAGSVTYRKYLSQKILRELPDIKQDRKDGFHTPADSQISCHRPGSHESEQERESVGK